MAFSKAPVADTYSSVRIPLMQWETTDPVTSNDGLNLPNLMMNVLPKKLTSQIGDEGWITQTRPSVTFTSCPAGLTSSQIRGLYVWEKTLTEVYYFVVIGQNVYTSTNVTGPFTAVTSFLTAATTPVRFTEFINDTNTKSLIAVDGVEGYVFTSSLAGTKIVDADFPSPHLAFPIFLNGRLYLGKKNTGDIYASDLNNPSSWTAGTFISSEVYPDDIQALVKIDNYILAIGLVGSEFFYDAAIAIGSPLARVENVSLPFGTDYQNSIAATRDRVVLLTKSPDGNIVLRHIEGFKHTDIPCNFLNQYIPQVVTDVSKVVNVVGHFFRDAGSLYYNVTMDYTKNSDTDGDIGMSFTYCFEAKAWVQFSRGRDGNKNTYGSSAYKTYPVYFSSPGYGGFQTIVAGQTFNSPFVGLLSETNRGIDFLYLNSAVSTQVYYLSSVTLSDLTFGTMNRKFMNRLGVDYINDSDDGSAPFLPHITTWDYPLAKTSAVSRALMSGFQGVGLSSNTSDFPFLTQLGAFRRRWIRVETYGSLRYRYVEVDINKGQQ